MAKADLTAQRLRELLDYNPNTGLFTRRVFVNNQPAGKIAGSDNGKGYIKISVDKTYYAAHRLAWLYVYRVWPQHHIDHINGNPSDNRIDNLRDVPHEHNVQNQRHAQRRNRGSGILGVTKRVCRKTGKTKWEARISVGNKCRQIGTFPTQTEAQSAYVKAKRAFHPGCTI